MVGGKWRMVACKVKLWTAQEIDYDPAARGASSPQRYSKDDEERLFKAGMCK